jgi:regulator of protease activity HflC (stomatin/prohibitin superfamily)
MFDTHTLMFSFVFVYYSEAKEELALAVKTALAETMTGYGYQIVQVLITDLDPDQRVKNGIYFVCV